MLHHPGDDVAGPVRRIIIDNEDVRRQTKLEQFPDEWLDVFSLIVSWGKKQEFVTVHLLCDGSHRIVSDRISGAATAAAANMAINASINSSTASQPDSGVGISRFQRLPIAAVANSG